MSRVLVDTHAVLWWLTDDPALSQGARAAIADPDNEPLISAASVWEIAIKRSLGKLSAPDDLPEQISAGGFTWLPIKPEHAWQARDLPMHHRDAFDRVLVGQALVERVPILTSDPAFREYGVDLRW